ncbi:MAG: trypsin-like peptidase domain-containing protein [Bacteroidales bacterium]|nr:trypsin-like peptidase domain-containing protein [Bacteroidales bacterium]
MKKLLILIILSSIFSINLIGQNVAITPRISRTSFDDLVTPLLIATEAHRQAENQINEIKKYIIDILLKDIDDKLKSELNYEYTRLTLLSEKLDKYGLSQSIVKEINSIYNNTLDHITNYNNRVEQQKREYEREQKRIAEEQERQRQIEESQPKVWTGTGFALNNGYLVTNWHVADGARTIHVYGVRGDFKKKYIAEVVARDKINDLAILKISGNGFPGFGTIPYKVKTSTAEVAEDVWVLGFPLTMIMGDEVKYTDGRISALSGFDGDVSMYQISAPIQHGNSGGPVFDDSGNVIGIACAGIDNSLAQNANYAVKSSYLKNLIDAMQIANVLPTASQMSNYPRRQDKVKAVRNFVFYIECCDKVLSLEGVANRPSYIEVSPTSLYFSEMDESKTLVISTNAPSWKIKSKPNWCTATGKTTTSVTINVTKNDSHDLRNGTIELETSDGKSTSIYVSQSGKTRSFITANPLSINFDYNNGQKNISISTNSESWKITSKPDWCTTDNTSTSVTINVTKNESYENRNGIVELETNDGVYASIYVSQAGKERPYITAKPQSTSINNVNGWQKEISISTNSNSCKVSSKPDWCNAYLSPDYRVLTIETTYNNSYDERNGTIVLETNDGASVSISISQSGKERPYITVNPQNINFDEHEGQKTISVKTNSDSWNISSIPNWCTISKKTSSSITINARKNKSYKNRFDAIRLETNDGAESYINLFQCGKPSVTIGLNLGIGYQCNRAFKSLTGSIGIDMVWGRKNAYGLFLSYRTMDNISAGPLFVFGNFIIGAGVNLNVGRNIKSGLPESVQSRRLNIGCDGILRLGVKLGKYMYMFVEGGVGRINGVDYFYNEMTQSTASLKWSRTNGIISLGLGMKLKDGSK